MRTLTIAILMASMIAIAAGWTADERNSEAANAPSVIQSSADSNRE